MKWKDIKNYQGLYKISSNGEVYSQRQKKQMSLINAGSGYVHITFIKDGKRKTKQIHRLVAEHFLEKPIGKNIVNHKDLNKKNNSITNLEWVSYSENNKYSSATARGEKNINSKKIYQYDLKKNLIKVWGSIGEIVRETGFHRGSLSQVCNGKRKTASGFIWSFKEITGIDVKKRDLVAEEAIKLLESKGYKIVKE